jgi:hypothetical protein
MKHRSKKPTRPIPDRDRMILDHVVRYRLTVNQVLQKLFFPDNDQSAVSKVTGRLCRAERLAKFKLHHPRVYFTLAAAEAQNRGLSNTRAQPLGPQSLPTEYAVLAYATLGSVQHRRLAASELEQSWPWLPPETLDSPHCIDESAGHPVLEMIRVDLGGKPDHVARKCYADIQARRSATPFESFVRQGRFRLVVVAGTREKAAAIQAAIAQHVWPDGLQVHLVVIPELLLLTASSNNGT